MPGTLDHLDRQLAGAGIHFDDQHEGRRGGFQPDNRSGGVFIRRAHPNGGRTFQSALPGTTRVRKPALRSRGRTSWPPTGHPFVARRGGRVPDASGARDAGQRIPTGSNCSAQGDRRPAGARETLGQGRQKGSGPRGAAVVAGAAIVGATGIPAAPHGAREIFGAAHPGFPCPDGAASPWAENLGPVGTLGPALRAGDQANKGMSGPLPRPPKGMPAGPGIAGFHSPAPSPKNRGEGSRRCRPVPSPLFGHSDARWHSRALRAAPLQEGGMNSEEEDRSERIDELRNCLDHLQVGGKFPQEEMNSR